ncbi:hypothetical protein B0H66DRAFT_546493 [Apodospora peruviana]|uniref:Uncharacterized protein n=1 Tax=Apodospora peruviana TaxID=516989 RepID=A0AAE0IUB2_9PEZI|nr:hypothetical protein B0H66DRAFT_546493 [Apodospora peruviana]
MPTIYDALVAPNPKLDIIAEQLKNTPGSLINVEKDNVSIWHDFNRNTILAAYHDLLSFSALGGALPAGGGKQKSGGKGLSLKEFWSTISATSNMSGCAYIIRNRLGLPPLAASGSSNGLALDFHPFELNQGSWMGQRLDDPDWFVYAGDKQNHALFVLGEGKTHHTWHSSRLASMSAVGTHKHLLPLQLVATCLRHTGTRYGFLVTAHEFVALRVHHIDSYSIGHGTFGKAGVEYRAIPWHSNSGGETSGAGGLTVNLALWALAMMGANDSGRIYGELGTYLSASPGVWSRAADGSLVHTLSGRRASEAEVRAAVGDEVVIMENSHGMTLRSGSGRH